MSNDCSVREICMFDLEKLSLKKDTAHTKCFPNVTLKKYGDLCSKNSYCCVICSTMGCHVVDIEKWGFKRTLLRMKLKKNEI